MADPRVWSNHRDRSTAWPIVWFVVFPNASYYCNPTHCAAVPAVPESVNHELNFRETAMVAVDPEGKSRSSIVPSSRAATMFLHATMNPFEGYSVPDKAHYSSRCRPVFHEIVQLKGPQGTSKAPRGSF